MSGTGQAREDAALVADVRNAIGAIVNSTEQSDQIDGIERLAYRSLNQLSVRLSAVEAERDTLREALERIADSNTVSVSVAYEWARNIACAALASAEATDV